MKKEIKKLWVKALRSGEYKKGQFQLKSVDGQRFCCLGVLTDLYIKKESRKTGWNGSAGFDSGAAALPPKVMKWAGLTERDPQVKTKDKAIVDLSGYDETNQTATLSLINDRTNKGFRSIATLIEKHL